MPPPSCARGSRLVAVATRRESHEARVISCSASSTYDDARLLVRGVGLEGLGPGAQAARRCNLKVIKNHAISAKSEQRQALAPKADLTVQTPRPSLPISSGSPDCGTLTCSHTPPRHSQCAGRASRMMRVTCRTNVGTSVALVRMSAWLWSV